MNEKSFLTGNEAVARGFYEAGGHLATGYPGTPTSETIQIILNNYKDIYAEYSQNEVVAAQVAGGASISGARVMTNMKQLGLNVALDFLMTFTQAYINGGFLLFVADDPGLTSTQNEQDSRMLGKYANMGILCPSNSQEMKDFAKFALDISEEYNLPMMLRATTPLCLGAGIVTLNEKRNRPIRDYRKDQSKYCMFPPYANVAQQKMRNSINKLEEYAYNTTLNVLEKYSGNKTLIITAGYMYPLIKELKPRASILKLGLIYPLSKKRIKELGNMYDKIIVCEELLPFIEDEIKIAGVFCEGKSFFSYTGNLDMVSIAKGLIKAGVFEKHKVIPNYLNKAKEEEDYAIQAIPCMRLKETAIDTVERSSTFYAGCPHRPIFNILKNINATIVGDIGCYTMGLNFPWKVNEINMNMGSSPGIIKGIAEINKLKNDNIPLIALIGDGTFFHSGILGIANLLHNEPKDSNITIIILNNGITALTGFQPNSGTGNYADCRNPKAEPYFYEVCGDSYLKPHCLLKDLGFNDVVVVDQFKVEETKKIINNTILRKGVKFIVTSRPCVTAFNIQSPYFVVDEKKCIACRKCTRLNCPPIRRKRYENEPILKAYIDPILCTGCSVCAQICPVNAIKPII